MKSLDPRRLAGSTAMKAGLDQAVKRAVDDDGNPTPTFQKAVLSALSVQRGTVLANLQRMRRRHPEDSPAEIADRLTKQYLNLVSGVGAAAGGTAVVPGVGTVAAVGLSLGAAVGFLEVTALYAQSIAELHGIPTRNDERGQALVMMVMLGKDGRKILKDATSGSGTLGGSSWLVTGMSGMSERLFNRISQMFMKRLVVKQGAHLMGRLVPFGIGAAIGGFGNRALGRSVVTSAQNLFGALPQEFPDWPEAQKKLSRAEKRALDAAAEEQPAAPESTEATQE
ncbi:hypothetical protein [Citricoccus sp. NR2]|uniref:hypothetical protein n=1 Tax=Citricoccus sp. NR2 TaxID=3004095 RepID=UPI0022DD48FA|nr:hypothetical protein [Citricoccus sp. NR2]WBL19599.1 hypothetical protein O1A05_02530 [Citricoccus sp. NR2]